MIHNLAKIYPNSLLNPENNEIKNIEEYYLVEIEEDQLYISTNKLNLSEIELLNLLTQNRELQSKENNLFKNLLFNGVVDEGIPEKNVRLIYLRTTHLEAINFDIWRKTLVDSLIEIVEVLFVSDDLSVAILDTNDTEKNLLNRFSEVILSLDQDFNLLTIGMIGQAANINPQIKDIFDYERKVFQNLIRTSKIEGIITLSDLLIQTIGVEFNKGALQLPILLNYLYEEKEIQQLIYHLFQNHGNLSQTANALYLHRNTLSYRIDQFYKKTGFDLTYLPDLMICYLLII